jgi:hypothetical protein
MRKAKIILAVALAAIVVILGAVWLLLDPNRFRGDIQARLEQQLGRKVELGEMSLRLFPVRFTVQNVRIAEDSGFKSEFPFTQTDRLDVDVSLLGLIAGNVKLDSIELVQPRVELIRNEKGLWNFSSLSRKDASPPEPALATSTNTTPSAGSPSTFSLKRLAITGGSIAITDQFRKKPRMVYGPIDLALLDYTAGKPFSFDVAMQQIRIKGNAGPLPESGPARLPLKATVSLTDVNLASLGLLSSGQGSLSGETFIESQSGKLTANGKLSLKDTIVSGLDIGYPIMFDYAMASDLDKGLVNITSATLRLGPTPVELTGSVNVNPNPAEVDLRLKIGDAAVTEVARLASAFGIVFARDTTVTGQVSGDVRARGPLDRIALNGSIGGRDLQVSGKTVPQPIHVRALNITLTPSEIRSNEFEAVSGQTTVFGRLNVQQYSSKNATMDVALRAPGATLSEVQTIAKAYGVKGLDQLSGAGKVNFDLHASGPMKEVASANIAKTLNGTMNIDFNTVRIHGFDATSELARIGRFLKLEKSDKGYTDVIRLAGRINVKNGVAETTDLHAQLLEGTLTTTGSSDLSSQTLNLKAMAVFSKEFSDKVGGTRIGGFLTTALANEKGEIVIPALISGDIKKPKFYPDTKTFLQLQKQRLLPGLWERITGKKEEPAEPGKEPTKPGGVRGLLEGIFGGKK